MRAMAVVGAQSQTGGFSRVSRTCYRHVQVRNHATSFSNQPPRAPAGFDTRSLLEEKVILQRIQAARAFSS